jgi:5-hydroxyisourate hydrolase-like protein (transthyretin family)
MASASPITTHVLDTARGMPAKGVPICLEIQEKRRWTFNDLTRKP